MNTKKDNIENKYLLTLKIKDIHSYLGTDLNLERDAGLMPRALPVPPSGATALSPQSNPITLTVP